MTIPVAPIAGLAAGMAGPVQAAFEGRYYDALRDITINYTGYNPQAKAWAFDNLKTGLVPLLIGVAVHKGASMLGVNRMLAAAKVPFIRV